jgi:cell fate regulator YaaT (PSP1 superfamily)
MKTIIGVRFKQAGKIYYFDPKNLVLRLNDEVVVETSRGVEIGVVALEKQEVKEESLKNPIKPVLRKATEKDIAMKEKNREREAKAAKIFAEKVEEHNLQMHLVDVDYTFDGNKITFYFTADGRVDFRELVKSLASVFRVRIELRQIGVRDEAKSFGGIGPCGREICCAQWLGDFQPVSIKMAKEQGLSLNPNKISGVCGRLLCCLNYEEEFYEEVHKKLPVTGTKVKIPTGETGTITKIQTLKEQVFVRIIGDDDDPRLEPFSLEEIEILPKGYVEKKPAKQAEKASLKISEGEKKREAGKNKGQRDKNKKKQSRNKNERSKNDKSNKNNRNNSSKSSTKNTKNKKDRKPQDGNKKPQTGSRKPKDSDKKPRQDDNRKQQNNKDSRKENQQGSNRKKYNKNRNKKKNYNDKSATKKLEKKQ